MIWLRSRVKKIKKGAPWIFYYIFNNPLQSHTILCNFSFFPTLGCPIITHKKGDLNYALFIKIVHFDSEKCLFYILIFERKEWICDHFKSKLTFHVNICKKRSLKSKIYFWFFFRSALNYIYHWNGYKYSHHWNFWCNLMNL